MPTKLRSRKVSLKRSAKQKHLNSKRSKRRSRSYRAATNGVEKEMDGEETQRDGVEKEMDGEETQRDGVEKWTRGARGGLTNKIIAHINEAEAQWVTERWILTDRPKRAVTYKIKVTDIDKLPNEQMPAKCGMSQEVAQRLQERKTKSTRRRDSRLRVVEERLQREKNLEAANALLAAQHLRQGGSVALGHDPHEPRQGFTTPTIQMPPMPNTPSGYLTPGALYNAPLTPPRGGKGRGFPHGKGGR